MARDAMRRDPNATSKGTDRQDERQDRTEKVCLRVQKRRRSVDSGTRYWTRTSNKEQKEDRADGGGERRGGINTRRRRRWSNLI